METMQAGSGRRFWKSMLQLSLLQGLSEQDILAIAEHVRFNFHKMVRGHRVVFQGEQCKNLVCILNGDIISECLSDAGHYKILEFYQAPLVIEPRALFGMNRAYERTYVAGEDVQVLEIDRAAVRDVLLLYPTVRFNLLNSLCFTQYRLERHRWKSRPATIEERFITFLKSRAAKPAGRKELHVTLNDLAEELDTRYIHLSRALHGLAKKGLLEMSRKRIYIPRIELLSSNLYKE